MPGAFSLIRASRLSAPWPPPALLPIAGACLLAMLVPCDANGRRLPDRGTALLQVAAARGNAHLDAIGDALSRGNPAGADGIAKRFLDAVRYLPDAHLAVGVAFAQHGYFPRAASHFRKAQQLAPGNYIIDFNLGLALFRSNRFPEAAEVLESTVHYRDTAELRHLLADVYEHSERYIEALREYENAVRLEPDNETYWFALAYELLKHRTHDAAATALEAAVKRFPGSFRLRLALGITYFARRQYEQAANSFIEASDMEPVSVGPYRMLAAACENLARWDEETLARFRRLMQVNPATPWGPYLYALAREQSLEADRAPASSPQSGDPERLYLESIALDGDFTEARYRLGRLYRKLGRTEEAVRELEAAALARRDWPEPRYELARAYLQLGRREDAEIELREHRELVEDEERKRTEELRQVQRFMLLLE